jgi:hypothetical protein
MAITFDPTKQASQFTTIGFAGKYNVEIIGAEPGVSKSSGNDMMTLEYRVLDGTEMGNTIPFDSFVDDSAEPGKKYYAFYRINSLLAALGVNPGFVFDLRNEQQVKQIVGSKLSVTVDWRENNYNGRKTWQTNVTSYGPMLPESVVDTNKPRPAAEEPAQGSGTGAFGNTGTGAFGNGGGTGAFGAPAPAANANNFGGGVPAPTDNDQPTGQNFGATAGGENPFGANTNGANAFGGGTNPF